MSNCPGQNSQYWKPEDIFEIACAHCGQAVEFFKTDGTRRCAYCGNRLVNPKVSLGCARWCKQAKECLGYDPALLEQQDSAQPLVDGLIAAMKAQFGDDQPRISHALQVLAYAEEIARTEQGDPRVVYAAAILHDIGIQEAERRHGSSDGHYQELEGPPIARRIMSALGVDADTIEHVCRIVGSHHSAGDIDSPEFRIVWDADWLVNMPVVYANATPERLCQAIEKIFRTEVGKQLASRLYLG